MTMLLDGTGAAATGMGGIVQKLVEGLTPDVFFAQVSELIPFVIVMVPVALGIYFLRKLIKGAGKAKVRF